MRFNLYKNFENDYDSYTKDLDYGYSFGNQKASPELVNHFRNQYAKEQGSGEPVDLPSKRSFLNRAIDLLMLPNYVSAGFVDGIADGKGGRTPLQGAIDGFKAGNPFGDGYKEGRTTYSDVLETSGWNPESLGGKIAKGTVGFGLDVVLDPTTYLTGGGSAIVKGTGKVGAKATVSKAAKEVASNAYDSTLLTERLAKHGDTNHAISKEMVDAATKAEQKILKENTTHMTPHMAEQIIKEQATKRGLQKGEGEIALEAEGFAKKYNELLGVRNYDKELRLTWGIGNMPFAPTKWQDKVIDLGSMENVARFSDKVGLSKPYAALRNHIYGGQIGKLFSNTSSLYKLAKESPEDLWTALEYQSRTRGIKADKLASDNEIHRIYKELNIEPSMQKEIREMLQDKTIFSKVMDKVKVVDSEKVRDIKKVLNNASEETSERLNNILENKEFAKKWSNVIESDSLKESAILKDMNEQFKRDLVEFDVKYAKDKEELDKFLNVLNEEFKSISKPLDDVESINKLYDSVLNERKLNAKPLNEEGSKSNYKYYEDLENALSSHIYGETGMLKNLSSSATDELMKMINSGTSPARISTHIRRNRNTYDPHMRDVNEFVAKELGYKGWHSDGFKNPLARLIGKSPEEVKNVKTDDVLVEVSRAYHDGKLNEWQERKYVELMQLSYKRDVLRGDYRRMSPEEFAHYRTEKANSELAEEIFGKSEDALMEKRRSTWIDNEHASESRKVNTSGESEYAVRDTKLEKLTSEDHGMLIDELVRNGIISPSALKNVDESFINYLNRFTDSINALSETMFKRSFNDMTPNQKSYALSLARNNINNRGSKNVDPRIVDQIKKEADERAIREAEIAKAIEVENKHLTPEEIYSNSVVAKSEAGRKQVVSNEIDEVKQKLLELDKSYPDARSKMIDDYNNRLSNQKQKVVDLETRNKELQYALSKSADEEVARLTKAIEEQQRLLNDDDALLTYLQGKSLSDIELIRDAERYSKGVTEVDSFSDGRLANVSKDGNIMIKKNITPEELLNHLRGTGDTPISRQKSMVLDELSNQGWSDERIMNAVSSPEKAKRLLLEHEFSHIKNKDSENYWANGRDMLTPDKIEIETRATREALEMIENFDVDKFKRYESIDTGKIVLDGLPVDEEVKSLVKSLREKFMEMGQKEVEIGKLSKEQLEANLLNYLPRIPTPEGEAFFRHINDITPSGENITQDFGFGVKFNPHGKSRTIKGATVEEVNKYFKEEFPELLKGKNVFSENVADIYMARAMKHNEIMYDDKYMREMLEVFGKDIGEDGIIEEGYKAVANYGMMKKSIEDYTAMSVSMRISEDVTDFIIKNKGIVDSMAEKSGLDPAELLSKQIDEYVSKTFTDEVISDLASGFRDEIISSSKLPSGILGKEGMPMQELSAEQSKAFSEVWASKEQSYRSFLENKVASAASREDIDRLKELQKQFDKLNNYTPPQIKQVNSTIVEMANQSRKLQIAKDESQFLTMYDKFTHFMKVNQTVVLPAYHTRNKLSNLFNNWLAIGQDAFNKDWTIATTALSKYRGDKNLIDEAIKNKKFGHKELAKGVKIAKPHKEVEAFLDGDTMAWSDLYDLALRYDVIDTGQFAMDIGAGSSSGGLFNKLRMNRKDGTSISLDPTNTRDFVGYKLGTKVGTVVENSDRLIHFGSMLKQGKSLREASESSKKYLFDYSEVTAFEQNVMKRIFPYYTWMRKNARLQLGELIDNPGKYRDLGKVIGNIERMTPADERMEDEYMANWTEGWIKTPFSKKTGKDKYDEYGNLISEGKRSPLLLSANLPYMDLARLPDITRVDQSLRDLISQSATQIKAPLELGLNHNFFFNDEIASEDDSKASKYANYLASHLGVANIASSIGKSKDASDLALRTSNTFTGVKLSPYDYKSSKAELIKKTREGYTETPIDDAINRTLDKFKESSRESALSHIEGIGKMVGQRPKSLDEYEGALRPISVETYNNLPEAEKAKYEAPTKDEVNVYNKKAIEMTNQELEKTGKLKRFTWTLLDKAESIINPNETEAKMGYVSRVIDGDTLKVKIGDKEESVRLLLIDTPETQGDIYSMFPMPYGKEAATFAKEKTLNKDVKLHIVPNRDAYGRVLAYVELEDGTDFNKAQIEQGNARVRFTKDANNNKYYDRTDEYYDAQSNAYDDERGLWSLGGYGGNPYEEDGLYMGALTRYLHKYSSGK